MTIPIAHSTESLGRFLQHIVASPIPDAVTPDYLREQGFVSGNDVELRHIFRILGFLDESGQPLARWAQYKEHGKEILRTAVEECYAELFALYPNPYTRSDEALQVWFRPPNTGDSKSSVERAIRTFKRLSQLAGIVPTDKPTANNESAAESKSTTDTTATIPIGLDRAKFVLQLPILSSKAQYIELFEAIKEVFL